MDKAGLGRRFAEAERIARKASGFLLSHEDLRSEIAEKAENDYVTSADRECERLIISEIRRSFPDDIDPIDGTVDFMASFPDYTVSIAFQDEDGIAFGVVAVPRQGEIFTAMRGEGAYLNGKRIRTDEKLPLGESLAILVPPHRYHMYLHDYMMKMEKFYSFFSDMRSLGSAAISLCYVAAGRCSAYYELGLHIYDIAAGMLILSEAGGRISLTEKDGGWIDIAASSQQAYGKMMEIVDG